MFFIKQPKTIGCIGNKKSNIPNKTKSNGSDIRAKYTVFDIVCQFNLI